jgi:dTDP-4-amino-4,6-dideoxygalactose transaminase
MDPDMLAQVFADRASAGCLPKAAVVVHLYGQCADLGRIAKLCDHYGVALIEDAAEALGATYRGRSPGTFGKAGIFSFNGNKIITTSGGGMLVSNDGDLIAHARKLSTQARDPGPHYEHSEIGYNYRLSNVLAAIGVGQLEELDSRVAARRRNFEYYRSALADVCGVTFMPEAPWGLHTRWLTCVLLDPREFPVTREGLRLALEREGIEARPLWKPMHLQPVFQGYEATGGGVSEHLFRNGLCLPSGSNLTESDLECVVGVIREVARGHSRASRQTGALLRAAI